MDEAIAILRECAGALGADGAWQSGWDELVVHALHDGDEIEPWETVMTIEGDYSLFCHLETVYLGTLSRRTLIARNVREVVRRGARQADPLLPGAPRPPPRADGRRLRRAHRRRDRRLDRRAGLVVGRARDGHGAARPDRGLRRRHRAGRAALRRDARRRDGHRRARRLRQRLRAARPSPSRARSGRGCGACGSTRRRRWSTARCRRRWAASTRAASTRSSCGTCARRSTARASRRVRIVVSGGFNVGQDRVVRGRRGAGRRLRRRLGADPRRERLHGRRGRARRPAGRQGGRAATCRTRASSAST